MHDHDKKKLDEQYHFNKKTGKELYSFVKSKKSIDNAWHGIMVFAKTTNNLRFHVAAAIIAIYLGFYFHINTIEWLFVVLAIGIVIIAECFNTAIEFDIDLTSPEYHPYAKYTKDVAAGAVLLSAITATIIGLIIFVPKFLLCF